MEPLELIERMRVKMTHSSADSINRSSKSMRVVIPDALALKLVIAYAEGQG